MATTKNFAANKGKATRRQRDGTKQGSGDERHLLFGASGSGQSEWRYRSLVRFAHVWTGVKRVVKMELAFRTEDDSAHFGFGGRPRVRIHRLTADWPDGSNSENEWTAGEYDAPSAESGAVEQDLPINPATGLPQDEAWVYVDITSIAKPLVPTGVLMPDGSAGGGKANYGFLLRAPGDEYDHKHRGIGKSFDHTTPSTRPYILLTYDPQNQAPTAPTLTGPATTDNDFGDQFTGSHADPDGDPMAAREIVVYPAGGSTPVWTLPANLQSAGLDESQTGVFSVPLQHAAASLKLQTAYEWVARTRDPSGLWGPFSTRRALRLTSSAPTVTAIAFPGDVETLAGVNFGGAYSDPESDLIDLYRIQMQPGSGASWADSSLFVWDTGEVIPTLTEQGSNRIARPYGGRALSPGTYTYRLQARDDTGVWSAWSQATFTLTLPFDPDPGAIDNLTIVGRRAPVRVHLWRMGANRGRGTEIGTIDDPIDLGASTYMNQGGEVYFTLPALHPYCPEVEPHHTHYAVEQYYGDRYRELFAGIISDFDADGDTMVAYGRDYLGLLQTAVDERYNPDKPELAAPTGSKYNSMTISAIVTDQLNYHRGLANSPVKFIAMGAIDALAERATIYSTYTEALPFISGLIDSHKQGTGREARLYVKPLTTPGSYQFVLKDNWGKDRPNIRLEYGGMVNDFRVVALGDFGTRVLGVGQKRGEVKVYRATGTGGLNEAEWGRVAQTRFFQDIIDQNDLQRRVNEAAMQLAKVGKRIALAIPANVLAPFDGYDIGDSIIVDIQRGVVDTPGYGSGGYWTIYGLEWRYHPDAHDELTLTLLPKKTLTGADPDLIPSRNPGVGLDWQAGYGVPATYGDLPGPTPPPSGLMAGRSSGDEPGISTLTYEPPSDYTAIAKHWEDLNTGCVYELDDYVAEDGTTSPTFGTYVETFCPPTGDGGGGGVIPPPPLQVTGLVLTPDADILLDGTLRPYVRAEWDPLDPTDLSRYDLEVVRGATLTPSAWTLELVTATAVLPPDTYVVSVASRGTDGGSSLASRKTIDLAAGEQLWVKNLAANFTGPPFDGTFDIYVGTDTVLPRLYASGVGTADVQVTAVPAGGAALEPTISTAFQWGVDTLTFGTYGTTYLITDLQPNVSVVARVRGVDSYAQFGPWSDDETTTTVKDNVAPSQPTAFSVVGGYRLFGAAWKQAPTPDLLYFQLRYRLVGETAWEYRRIIGTFMVINGLEVDGEYEVGVRAIDTSRNVEVDAGPPQVVGSEEDIDAGWVDSVTVTLSAITPEDIAVDELFANYAHLINIDASQIVSGSLEMRADGDSMGNIAIYAENGQLTGYWSPEGWYLIDPADPSHAIRGKDGTISFTADGSDPIWTTPEVLWGTAIGYWGINADYITTGSLDGGHNRLLNSGFEILPTGVIVSTPKTWTTTADFDGTIGTVINADGVGNALVLVSYAP